MATIAELVVKITGSIRDFLDKNKQAKKSMDSVGKLAKKVGGLIAGMFAIRAIKGFIEGQLAAIDALGKTADRLGLATERLAGLRHAAEQTGVSTATLDMALQRMVRRVAEAAQGTGEAKGALQELGISAEALARLSPDEQFRRLADAMQGVTNQGDRVRLAMKLFDSEGVALVNTMRGGSAQLMEFQSEAEKLGIALDRSAVKKIEDANDAINRLKASLLGVAAEVLPTVAVLFERIADALVAAVENMRLLQKEAANASKFENLERLGTVLGVLTGGGANSTVAINKLAALVAKDEARKTEERKSASQKIRESQPPAPPPQLTREYRERQARIRANAEKTFADRQRRLNEQRRRSPTITRPSGGSLAGTPFDPNVPSSGGISAGAANGFFVDFKQQLASIVGTGKGGTNAAAQKGTLAAFQQIQEAKRAENLTREQLTTLKEILQAIKDNPGLNLGIQEFN